MTASTRVEKWRVLLTKFLDDYKNQNTSDFTTEVTTIWRYTNVYIIIIIIIIIITFRFEGSVKTKVIYSD